MATMKIAPKCGNCHGLWCEGCRECHVCGSEGWLLEEKDTLMNARTQKAKGVLALKGQSGIGIVPEINGIIRKKDQISHYPSFPFFARPCPMRPRHGFVNSRIVQSSAELEAVLTETLAADPDGEVMLMRPLEAKWSAVLTPSLLTIGPSNDGATAGRDTVSIPVRTRALSSSLLKEAMIGQDEDPYLEFVKTSNLFVTQLRAGPKMEGHGMNYIPADIEVKEIIDPLMGPGCEPYSLLDWEKKMNDLKGRDGVVVSHIFGSMTDHYSVHARLNKIPVILSGDEPKIGAVLKKETDDSTPFSPHDVLKGIVIGERLQLAASYATTTYPLQTHVALLLTVLYNSPSMVGEYGRWLGIAASLMLRLGSAALSGEARHAKKKEGLKGMKGMKNRDEVYAKVLPFSLSRHRARLNRLINVLRYGFDGGGIGGEKWAKCGASLIPLFNSIAVLAREPNAENVAEIAKALNVAVDQAHNNGWWLNKFADQGLFKHIQEGKISSIMKSGDAIYAFKSATVDDATLLKHQSRYAEWEPLTFRPVRMTKAVLASLPNLPGLSFNISTRLLAGHRTINVPAKALTETVVPLLGQFYLLAGKHGLMVEMRTKDGDKVKVWEEKALI